MCSSDLLQPTRLPDGRMGLIVGKMNLAYSVMARLDMDSDEEYMKGDRFGAEMDRVKADYRDYFGVDEVIIIDEDRLQRQRDGYVNLREMIKGSEFFHNDMMIKTATNPAGERVAYITNIDNWPEDPLDRYTGGETPRKYLARVRAQFEELGYKIVEMPCTNYAALNYANTIMFDHPEEGKTVVVPQYGEPTDAEAVAIYEREGFKVRKVDMSFVQELTEEQRRTMGSVHCRFAVLS